METKNIRLRSRYGEIITCSVKEVTVHESGRKTYRMDNKKCNDFHNSNFMTDAEDCRVRSVDIFASGKYTVYGSYKNRRGYYRQGAQGIDVEIVK